MSEIDNKISALKARIDAGRIASARAEVTRQTAQNTVDTAMAQLSEKFGVDTVEQARAKLKELQDNLHSKMNNIVQKLDDNNL